MFDSIRSVTSSAVGALEHISKQTSPGFSVRDWVDKESSGVLFMPYKAGRSQRCIPDIRLDAFGHLRNHGSEADPKNAGASTRLWFVVDELDALGQIDD